MRSGMVMVTVVAGLALVAGCDDATGPADGARVSVQFAATPSLSGSAAPQSAVPGGLQPAAVMLSGVNGSLELDTIHVVVDEFELERSEDVAGCDDDEAAGVDDDACEEFEVGPTFVALGLDAAPAVAASAPVPAGSYDELEFEIEDLEDDEEGAEGQRIAELLASIRSTFPEWPREASMRVAGTFTPTGGEAQRFVAYFEAEIEVELEFATPFVVSGDEASRIVTVELNPADWFTRPDGSVLDLTQYDYASTGLVVEFELEMEHGFEGVEHDHEDD